MPRITASRYHWANKILFYYFLGILVWAPLPLASNRDWSTRLLAGLLLGGLLWAALLLALGKLRVTPALTNAKWVVIALTLTQLWVATQLLLGISVEPTSTSMALLLGCGLVAAFVLALLLLDTSDRVKTTAHVMIACGVFQAFFASAMMLGDIEQIAFLDKTFGRSRATGSFVNRNHLAGFLAMNLSIGIGVLVGQLHTEPTGSWREFLRRTIDTLLSRKFRLRLYLVLMVIALVLTRSRMGNTAFFSALLICGITGMVLQQKISRAALVFFASLLIVDLYLVGNWFGVDKVVTRLQNTSLEQEKRDEVALDSVAMWQDNFWTGTGADTFFQAYVYGGYKSPDSLNYRHAHNDYLEVGSGYGFIGFALLAYAVGATLLQALRAQRKRRWQQMQGLGFASTMGITYMLLHSFTDFNLHIPANALWFVVLMAFAWVACTVSRQRADG